MGAAAGEVAPMWQNMAAGAGHMTRAGNAVCLLSRHCEVDATVASDGERAQCSNSIGTKKVWQSDEVHGGVVGRTVDGCRTMQWAGACCAHTSSADPWWTMELFGGWPGVAVGPTLG